MNRRRFGTLLLAAAAAGCGEIPQPFRHAGPPPPLTRPKLARGLTVRPIDGLPDGTALSEALIKALEVHEVPAVVRGGPAFGHVVEAEPGERGGQRGLIWVLRSPGGEAEPLRFQPLPPTAWAGLGPAAVKREADATAQALAVRLTDPDLSPPGTNAVPAASRPSVTVKPFKGLPGDGDAMLARATRQALDRAGLVVRDQGGDYSVEARLSVIPGLPGEETVVVSWTVRDKADAELATIDQEGVVPRGRLESPWGTLARDIAEGGAAGVREVVKAASERR
ncbi:MAG: hypothetical protein AB1918_08355 [Pseudomonadota bacterium]